VRVAAHGLSVDAPSAWEVAIYRRPAQPGETTFPVLHAATVALPAERGDYGSGLVELLGPSDVFVSLLDFGPGDAGSRLFASQAVPTLAPDMYRPKALQRVIAGQAGVQRFFTVAGRAFCLYSVVGSYAGRPVLCAGANQLVATLQIAAVAA